MDARRSPLRARRPHVRFDGVLAWTAPGGEVRYLIEEKRHLRNQDVRVVVEQMKRLQHELPVHEREDRLLLVSPGQIPVASKLLAYAELTYRGTAQVLEGAELLLPKVLGDDAR